VTEYPWEKVLEELNNYGCVIGDPVDNRIPISRAHGTRLRLFDHSRKRDEALV